MSWVHSDIDSDMAKLDDFFPWEAAGAFGSHQEERDMAEIPWNVAEASIIVS